MTQECGASTGNEHWMNNSPRVSLYGHLAAAIGMPNSRQAIWAATMGQELLRKVTTLLALATAFCCLTTLAGWAYAVTLSGNAAQNAPSTGFSAQMVSDAYRVAPALVLGLALALSLPLIALISRIIQFTSRAEDATRRFRPSPDDTFAAELPADAAPVSMRLPFVEIDTGGAGLRCEIAGDMLRIGREPDNDIRISNAAVHRYHAAIHREDYNDWHITDLSGIEGHGLIVNGRQCCEARLNDGDLIQLGPGRLRFHDGHV